MVGSEDLVEDSKKLLEEGQEHFATDVEHECHEQVAPVQQHAEEHIEIGSEADPSLASQQVEDGKIPQERGIQHCPQESQQTSQKSQPKRLSMASAFVQKVCSTSSGVAFVIAAVWTKVAPSEACYSGIGVMAAILALLLASRGFVQLHIRALMRPGILIIYPSSFHKKNLLRQRRLVESMLDMWSFSSLLASILFVLFLVRVVPDISRYRSSQAVESLFLEAFPTDVKIQISNGSLHMSSSDELHTFIPDALLQLCYFDSIDVDRVGVLDFALFLHLLRSSYSLSATDNDPYVRTSQFSVGETVEARLDEHLFACGAASRLHPTPLGGFWLPAKVKAAHPSSSLSNFGYTVCFEAEDGMALSSCNELENLANDSFSHNGTAQNCTVPADSLRRQQRVLFLPAGNSLQDSQLPEKHALLIFEKTRFAILEGYSYHHSQHWQWVTSGERLHKSSAELWHSYDDLMGHSYTVLQAAVGLFCEAATENDLACSQDIGRRHYEELLAQIPGASTILGFNLHLPLLLFGCWFMFVLSMIVVSTIEVVFIYWPIGYIGSVMFRHVDTPTVPMLRILCISMYSTRQLRFVRRVLGTLLHVWGVDGHLHPVLRALVEWERMNNMRILMAWALWNSYLVIRMREYISVEEHCKRAGLQRSRSVPPRLQTTTGTLPESASQAENTEGGQSTCAKTDDVLDLAQASVCRICYGGTESGRLFSPCLCTGSMRFVHLECLNMWRLSSANPSSFYKCDQCQYRYSFKRALYASVLRSAIVLHILTLAIFVLAVLICSYIALWLDITLGTEEGGAINLVADDILAPIANETGKGAEALRATLNEFRNMQWNGIHLIHFLGGMMMVGISGFISLGFFPIGGFFFHGPRHRDGGGPLLLILIVGTIRVLFAIYGLMRRVSGKLLRSAENMILDVGTGAPVAEASTVAPAVGAPPDTAIPELSKNEVGDTAVLDTTLSACNGESNEASAEMTSCPASNEASTETPLCLESNTAGVE